VKFPEWSRRAARGWEVQRVAQREVTKVTGNDVADRNVDSLHDSCSRPTAAEPLLAKAPFTRYNLLSKPVVTTGCIVYTNIQPLTTGLTTGSSSIQPVERTADPAQPHRYP